MSRPTMDLAIEALEAGDTETALELCKGMRHEWRFLHDWMAESMLGLVTYIQQKMGDDGVGEAWEESLRRGWKRDTGKIFERDRREIVEALGATWRAHSGSANGQHSRGLHDHRGRGEVHLRDEPLRLRPAPLAQWRLPRRGPLWGDRRGARLVL